MVGLFRRDAARLIELAASKKPEEARKLYEKALARTASSAAPADLGVRGAALAGLLAVAPHEYPRIRAEQAGLAWKALESGAPQVAADVLEPVVDRTPQENRMLGIAYLRTDRRSAAEAVLTDHENGVLLGHLRRADGRLQEAVAAYSAVPPSPEQRLYRGDALRMLGAWNQAHADVDQLADEPWALYERGRLALDEGSFAAAARFFHEGGKLAAETWPSPQARIPFLLGEAFARELCGPHEAGNATRLYQLVLSAEPDSALARARLRVTTASRAGGDLLDRLEELEAADGATPSLGVALAVLDQVPAPVRGPLWTWLERFAGESADATARAVREALGRDYLGQGLYGPAALHFSRLLSGHPDNAAYRAGLSESLFLSLQRTGDLDEHKFAMLPPEMQADIRFTRHRLFLLLTRDSHPQASAVEQFAGGLGGDFDPRTPRWLAVGRRLAGDSGAALKLLRERGASDDLLALGTLWSALDRREVEPGISSARSLVRHERFGGYARQALGSLLAASGDLRQAESLAAPALAGRLALGAARAALADGDLADADRLLARLTADEQVDKARSVITGRLAGEAVRDGRLQEAYELARKSVLLRPDVAGLHRAAVAASRAAEESADPDLLHFTAVVWATLLNTPAFWRVLEVRTRRAHDEQARAEARAFHMDRISARLRDLGENDPRFSELLTTLRYEARCTVLVNDHHGGRARPPLLFLGGPGLIGLFDGTPYRAPLEQALARAAEADPELQEITGPDGLYAFMLDDDREAMLRDLDPAALGHGALEVLTEAYARKAEDLLRSRAWPQLLEHLETYASHGSMSRDLSGLVAPAVKGISGDAIRNKDYAGAVDALERGTRLAEGDQEITAELGAAYLQWAITEHHAEHHEATYRLACKAMDVAEHDEGIRRNYSASAKIYARQLAEGADAATARRVLTEALARVADDEDLAWNLLLLVAEHGPLTQARELVARYGTLAEAYRANEITKAVDLHNKGDHRSACRLMQEAIAITDHWQLRYFHARFLLENEQMQKALSEAETAYRRHPGKTDEFYEAISSFYTEMLLVRSTQLLQSGDTGKALANIELARKVRPDIVAKFLPSGGRW